MVLYLGAPHDPALWVTLDLTTRYALSIFMVSDIEVFQKLILGILDVGVAVLAGGHISVEKLRDG